MTPEFTQFDSQTVRILEAVGMFAHPDLPDAVGVVRLRFREREVFICVGDEHDTLTCANTLPQSHSSYSVPLATSFWAPLIGKALTNAWLMTSDMGYPDALQLRFRELPNAGPYTTVQMYAEASQIVLTELKVMREGHAERNTAG